MGTLDDAIREHLELKKRSGAPEDEVKRLEHEAFGPVRREAPAPVAGEPADVPADAPVPEPPPVAPAAPAAPAAETPPPAGDDVAAVVAREPVARPPAPPPARDDEPWLADDELEDGPQPTSEFTAAEATDATGRPPTDHVAPDEEGEDLLEETPDFLQETPEHDRLWFEQRPPRDFDFDQ
jgi:hypothetical protein